MFGKSQYKFEHSGEKVSYTEYVIGKAIDHYGADPTSIKIKLAAAIKGENFTFRFDSREKMEEVLPGWLEAGFLSNATSPGWHPSEGINASDEWEADSRGIILHDLRSAMHRFGIPPENFSPKDESVILDPADTNGIYSSFERSLTRGGSQADTRDLYVTFIPQKYNRHGAQI